MGTKPKVPFAKTKSSDIESFSIAKYSYLVFSKNLKKKKIKKNNNQEIDHDLICI
jgi:hypothetical protein